MNTSELLEDGYERVRGAVHDALDGLPRKHLNAQLDSGTNSIAWLVWHLTRVQDDHIADAADRAQVWHSQNWEERFALPLPADSTGFGHTAKDVAAVQVDSTDPLLGYYDAVHEQTLGYVRGLNGQALDRIVDEAWDPPVTLGVRLVSVLADSLQHAGQAAFVRGVLERR